MRKQISLRTLLSALTIIAIGLALFGHRIRERASLNEEVHIVQQNGGRVRYESTHNPHRKLDASLEIPLTEPSRLTRCFRWIRGDGVSFLQPYGRETDRTDPEYWTRIPGVTDNLTELTFGDLEFVGDREILNLIGSSISMPKLQALNLSGTTVTSQSLEPLLLQYPSIEILALRGSRIDGRLLRSLVQLPNLRWLSLEGTNVTDADVNKLANCRYIERLHLNETFVSSKSTPALLRMPNLRVVDLSSTRFSDAEVDDLREQGVDVERRYSID